MLFWGACVKDGVATLDCLPIVFQNIIFAALLFAGIVALFLIIHAGFKFVLSSGDPKKVENARNTIVYAIMGLIIVLFAFLILNLVSFITGVNCIKFFGFVCGTSPSSPTPPPPLTCDNPSAQFIIFATSHQLDGTGQPVGRFNGSTVGGVTQDGFGADALCQNLASAAGLPGRYTAWLSDGTSEPQDRGLSICATAGINSASWHLPDGTLVADDWIDLTDGTLDNGISMDESGNIPGYQFAYTGTTISGSSSPGDTQCLSWTLGSATCRFSGGCAQLGQRGDPTVAWTDHRRDFSCDNLGGIYCFQHAP